MARRKASTVEMAKIIAQKNAFASNKKTSNRI